MTLSIVQVAVVLILGVSSFLSGWMLRRIQAKAREAELRKQIDSTHSAIPSLESSVRNRDQRIASLVAELSELKTKLPTLEVAAKRKDVDVLAKDRELRAAEARIAALTAEVADRDARLAVPTALPSFISLPVAPVNATAAQLEAAADRLREELAAGEAARRELETRLDAEIERGRTLDATLATRDGDVERERAEAAKWQARVPKLAATIKTRETTLAEREAQVAQQAAQLAERDAQLGDRAALLTQRDAELKLRYSEIATRDAMVSQRDGLIDERDRTLAQRNADMQSLERALAAATIDQAALRETLRQRDSDIAEFERQLAEASAAKAAQRQAVAERDATVAMHEQRIAAQDQRIAALIGERDAEAAQQAAKLATALRLGREEVDRHRAEFQIIRDELEAEREQYAQTVAAAAEAAERHSAVEAELNAHRFSLDAHATSLETQLTALHAQLAEYETALRIDADARAAVERELAQARDERAAVAAQLAAAEKHNVTRAQEADRQRADGDEVARRELMAEREAKAALAREFEDQTAELAELHDEVRELHTRVAPLESLLKQRDAALAERAERIDTLAAQIQAMATQNETQQTMLRQRGERIATLERKVSDAPAPQAAAAEPAERRSEHLEQRLVAQTEKNRELTKALEERERDMAAAVKAKDLNEKSMLVLKQQLDDARATEERLAGQLRDLRAKSQRAPEPPAEPTKVAMSKPAGLFELPPEQVDELQQIRGIGDGFERGLNKLGIYQFSQLAGLSAAEIVWIEAHLPTFHGRIERDDWPGQAAALMAASQHAEWSLRAQSPRAESPRIN